MLNKLKKLSVIHPFLLAIAPVLFLFAHNIYEVAAADLLLPIVAVIAGTLILFFSLRLITKSYNKIGIITSCFLVLFFSFEPIRQSVLSLKLEGFINNVRFWGSIWALLFIAGAFLVIKSRRNFQGFTKFLNITAVTLVAISLINIGIYEIKTIDLGQGEINEEIDLSNSENLPDIYYIILDEYARADTLKELCNYDNSEFINYLTNKGFYVASRSRSNYPSSTVPSLASSLNMKHLAESKDWSKSKNWLELNEMIRNNRVSQLLKARGYQYIFITTGYFLKDMDKYAEVYNLELGAIKGIKMSRLMNHLIYNTALAPFAATFWSHNYESGARASRLYTFDTLADMPNIKKPKFVFAHIACPHKPFVFDRNGNPPLIQDEGECNEKEAYLEQLIFVNKKLKTLVDEILSKSDVAPIIILQADTGPRSLGQSDIPEDELVKTQMVKIFNAYFLPENGNRLLYESVTPVNSFRIVFNLYFDTDYDLLEDNKSYFLDMTPVPPENNSD